jgi:phosphoglycerate dehydrogenase-like enzyme
MSEEIIILNRAKADGEQFKKILSVVDKTFATIPVYTKEELLAQPSLTSTVRTIFSTWYMPLFTEEEVREVFPSLKYIFYSAGTVKYFAEPFLRKGIRVFSAASLNGVPVAETVVAQIVLAGKGYFLAQKVSKSPLWRWAFRKARAIADAHPGNYGSKVGLIGCGEVGKKVVELLQPYDLKVFVYDPYVSDDQLLELGVQRMELNELFAECDVITNHLPDIASTRKMLKYEQFSRMKSTATFINTGRGAQVIEKDLARALRKRPRACGLLDVTLHEPPFPWSPLIWSRNVFLTPHIAGSLSGEYGRLAAEMVSAWKKVEVGELLSYEVTLEQLKNKT